MNKQTQAKTELLALIEDRFPYILADRVAKKITVRTEADDAVLLKLVSLITGKSQREVLLECFDLWLDQNYKRILEEHQR